MGSTEEYIDGYRAQLPFINTRLETAIETITARTHGEAVIIVQSDMAQGRGCDGRAPRRPT